MPSPSPPAVPHLRVAIVGSGFGGLGAAIRLKTSGLHDFLVFERAGSLGGVWRDNTYPGAACDVRSHLYSFSFAPNPDWSRAFSQQEEIRLYLEACADRFALRSHLRFHHDVLEARWSESLQRWSLLTSQGPFTADVLLAAVGALSEPALPSIPGLDTFAGPVFHSARWDHSVDLPGKRVAVIGTGASAIQFVPAIQPLVRTLSLFQRTPPWVLPRFDRALGPRERGIFRASPRIARGVRAGLFGLHELGAVAFFDPRLARVVQARAKRHLASSVHDPALRAKLTPRYTWGCKRILLSDAYYPAVTQPNVEVVTDRIERVSASGVLTDDGRLHEADVLVLGTGFRIQEFVFGRVVYGRSGRRLSDVWSTSMRAHLGTTVAGFPNLFLMQGPNSLLGHSSVVLMIEAQLEHFMGALEAMRTSGATSVEPTEEAQAAFVKNVDHAMKGTVWTAGGCSSWYLEGSGRNSTLWPGFVTTFVRRVSPFDPTEYRMARSPKKKQTSRPRALDRIGFFAARAIAQLPPKVQRVLAGGGPVKRGAYTLDPAIQLILASDPRMKKPWPEDALHLRKQQNRAAVGVRGPLPPVHEVRDLTVDGASGPLRARAYLTDASSTGGVAPPLLVFFHGGGFVFGDVDTHEGGCRLLCKHGGFHVLSVEYRLVPEHRFPAAIEDALAAFAWATRHASELGADPMRVGVGGDSAGANLGLRGELALAWKEARARLPAADLPSDRPHTRAPFDERAFRGLHAHTGLGRVVSCAVRSLRRGRLARSPASLLSLPPKRMASHLPSWSRQASTLCGTKAKRTPWPSRPQEPPRFFVVSTGSCTASSTSQAFTTSPGTLSSPSQGQPACSSTSAPTRPALCRTSRRANAGLRPPQPRAFLPESARLGRPSSVQLVAHDGDRVIGVQAHRPYAHRTRSFRQQPLPDAGLEAQMVPHEEHGRPHVERLVPDVRSFLVQHVTRPLPEVREHHLEPSLRDGHALPLGLEAKAYRLGAQHRFHAPCHRPFVRAQVRRDASIDAHRAWARLAAPREHQVNERIAP